MAWTRVVAVVVQQSGEMRETFKRLKDSLFVGCKLPEFEPGSSIYQPCERGQVIYPLSQLPHL